MKEEIDIIIGETITIDNESNIINLYIKNKNENELYATIKIPYLINHIEFLDIYEDPRYFLYEGYDKETKGCRYILMLKPFGNLKGLYRILNGKITHKVTDIEETGIQLTKK